MHLDKEPNQSPQLVVENEGEVLFANEALVIAGYPLGEGESVLSSPITRGGGFPKRLSPEDTEQIMRTMDKITESEPGTSQEALSKRPVDLTPVVIARLAIRGASIVLNKGERQ